MPRMTKEGKDLLDSYERGEWKSVKNLKTETNRYQKIARATLRKDKRTNIRISAKDLEEIQKRAIEEGIPYQTLISSILHKYASGTLVRRIPCSLCVPNFHTNFQFWIDKKIPF